MLGLKRQLRHCRLCWCIRRKGAGAGTLADSVGEGGPAVIPVEGFVTADWLLGRLGEAFAHVPEKSRP